MPAIPAQCPLLAQSGHAELHRTCPLLGVKRTSRFALQMSAFDPKRTCAAHKEISLTRMAARQGSWKRRYSKAKMRFQSLFMLITVQPFFFASS